MEATAPLFATFEAALKYALGLDENERVNPANAMRVKATRVNMAATKRGPLEVIAQRIVNLGEALVQSGDIRIAKLFSRLGALN